jgi:signal transduction histidine kinase
MGMGFGFLDTNGDGMLQSSEYLAQVLPGNGGTFEQALIAQTVSSPTQATLRDRFQGEINFEIGDGLLQVMGNLVDNALKYGVPGGTLRISATAAAGRVQLMFADDGVGIPEEDLPRIFDRLYRGDRSRSKRGLGLGLSLVRAVVEAHGGEISVASRPGEGSCFTVTIPQTVFPPDQVPS